MATFRRGKGRKSTQTRKMLATILLFKMVSRTMISL